MGRLLFIIGSLMAIGSGVGLAIWHTGNLDPVDEIEIARKEHNFPFESQTIPGSDGVDLHVVLAGPKDGTPVVLIHGFPEFWFSWRQQIVALAEAGYRVAAPDLRGYNRSDKPKGQAKYALAACAADIVALIDAQGWARANIAGHDVGATIAWTLIYDHPERINKAVVFNVAPLAALADATAAGATSVSWYRTAFRIPLLPELALRAGGYRTLANTMMRDAKEGAFSERDIKIYKSSWARENAISKMLGFYRAYGLDGDFNRFFAKAPVPSLFVGVGKDPYLPLEATEAARKYVDRVEFWPEVSHWILQEEPARTSALMIEYFGNTSD